MTIVFFKILAQNYPNNARLVPNLGIFVFWQKFGNIEFEGLVSNMTVVSYNSRQEIAK